ncbi:MAG TPA: glycosyltransferase family 2 protein [Ktedonobacteraceae bacterium]|nr:glycosyltransferase family 2 protein [Ktedonobacteraceae bacterium]
MTEATLDVSVVICAYTEERWQDLVAAVGSVVRQSRSPREVIVVIDHNAALYERACRGLSGARVIENEGRKGLSGARNSGIAIAQGELIAFLDDDAVAEPDWLERLRVCCLDPQVLGAGGVVEPLWSEPQPAWFPREFYWVVGCTYQKPCTVPSVVRNPYGGCTCMRREVFEGVGGFTDGLGRVGSRPLGGEETELCIRARQFWPERVFLYDPQARIHHRIPSKRGRWAYFCARCFSEGLSKAAIARCVGARDSLASERAYILHMLPAGVWRGMRDGLFHFDPAGFQRAGAILAGLSITVAGYLVGSFAHLSPMQESSLNHTVRFAPLPRTSN